MNGSSVNSKNLGQPILSIQSFILSQSLASSLYADKILFTIAVASGHLGGLLGIPAATSFWNDGLLLAFEWFPPTHIASLLCSGSLFCCGGLGGKHAPQLIHFYSSTSIDGFPLTIGGLFAATGHLATTDGRSHTFDTRS